MGETDVLEKVNAHTAAAFKAIGEPEVRGTYSDKQSAAYKQAMKEVVSSMKAAGYTGKESSRYERWFRRFV